MGRSEIDGDQIRDESLSSDDILDGSLLLSDLNTEIIDEISGKLPYRIIEGIKIIHLIEQMPVFGEVVIEGEVVIDGELILEI